MRRTNGHQITKTLKCTRENLAKAAPTCASMKVRTEIKRVTREPVSRGSCSWLVARGSWLLAYVFDSLLVTREFGFLIVTND